MTLASIASGWTGPLPFTLKVDGVTVNLNDFTSVTLNIRRQDGTIVTPGGTLTIDPDQVANKGKLVYAPVATDFVWVQTRSGAEVQPYYVRFRCVDGSSKVIFFPNDDADVIQVYRV